MQNYLGVATITNDNGDYTSVTGQGSVFAGLGPYALTYPFSDYSDPVTPDGTAELGMVGNNSNGAGVNKDSGDYKTAFWPFPWEAISTDTGREEALDTMLNWCGTEVVSISLTKTVGTDAHTYPLTDAITVTNGTEVTYFYVVENTGTITLPLHTLEDSQLGTVLGPDFAYDLAPGASVMVTATTTATETVTNIAIWEATDGGSNTAAAVDAATVNVINPAIALTKTVGTDPGMCATSDAIEVAFGTVVYYCYTVTNTGDVTLSLHDLDDDVLGTILTGLAYDLTPGASVDTVAAGLTISATITQTTVNTATWTAYNDATVTATASASATVTLSTYYLYLPVLMKP
jgi:hypothetical protein